MEEVEVEEVRAEQELAEELSKLKRLGSRVRNAGAGTPEQRGAQRRGRQDGAVYGARIEDQRRKRAVKGRC